MADVFRVRTLISGGSGASQISTMYFDTQPFQLAQDAADAVRTFWDSLRTSLSSSYHFQVELAVETINITTGKPSAVTPVTAAVVDGQSSGQPNPWATQGLIEWRTGVFVNGRELRGRTFIPGTLQGNSSGGAPDSGFVSTLNSAASALIADTDSVLVTYSRKHGQIAEVTAGTAWTKWAVLRSRRD